MKSKEHATGFYSRSQAKPMTRLEYSQAIAIARQTYDKLAGRFDQAV
jgi:hypothetical protein